MVNIRNCKPLAQIMSLPYLANVRSRGMGFGIGPVAIHTLDFRSLLRTASTTRNTHDMFVTDVVYLNLCGIGQIFDLFAITSLSN